MGSSFRRIVRRLPALLLFAAAPALCADSMRTSVDPAQQVRVNGYNFDPLADGEPALAPALQATATEAGFRLVQLEGATRDGWVERLAASGVRVLQYYPHYTYLVWSPAGAAAQAAALPFVRWSGLFHPAYKVSPDLDGRSGTIRNVDVMFYDDGQGAATLAAIRELGGRILDVHAAQPDKTFFDAIVELPAAVVDDTARLGAVLWLGFQGPHPVLDDEMSAQIEAGNFTAGVPYVGYEDWLDTIGLDGSGVRWAIIDTGVDWNHPDLASHIASGYDFPTACTEAAHPGTDCPSGGHGTHVAGIVGGDRTFGSVDGAGFFYGLGIAPHVELFAMNSLSGTPWPPAGGWQEHSKRAVLGQAIGGNNSWTTDEGTNHGYQASERTHDLMVRDGNFDTAAVAEPFIEVFSAGNSGPGGSTLTSPKEAKNLIAVAASSNYRVGSIETIASFSSRGPAVDGRIVPTIAAPGDQISSTRNDTGGLCSTAIPGTSSMYAFCSGTSMASPHVSGAVVLLTEWWKAEHAGAVESPAMARALLVNSAVDMGAADIPNVNEGWGRIHLGNLFAATPLRVTEDQTHSFAATGEIRTFTVGVPSPGQPVKITLAWSDAAGAPGANPALVNNLNLSALTDGNSYLGNRFLSGWSATGGSADNLNNIENVYVQNPGSNVEITLTAANIAGDGIPYNADTTDQDYALVCTNCALAPDYTLSATPPSQAVCAPADAVYDVNVGSILAYADPVTLSSGNPAGTSAAFGTNPVAPGNGTTLTIGNTVALAAGLYSIPVDGASTSGPHATSVDLELFTAAPDAATLDAPLDNATDIALQPLLDWSAGAQSSTYTVELASDAEFASLVFSATGLAATEATVSPALAPEADYYWRVFATNICGESLASAVFKFRTRAVPPTLLVDDDNDGPDITPLLSPLVAGAGEAYDVWVTGGNDTNEPTAADLAPYKRVIWFSGDLFGAAGAGPAGPGAAGATALAAWLDTNSGNCFVLDSQDYLYDHDTTAFATNYLGVASRNDDEKSTSVAGRSFFAPLGTGALTYPGGYSNYSDILTPTASALGAFFGSGGTSTGFTAVYKDNGAWKTMFLTDAIEARAGSAQQPLMDRILEYCDAIFQDGFDTGGYGRWSNHLP